MGAQPWFGCKAKHARALGCDEVILYREEDFAARCRELTDGQGVHAVYDGVGKATFLAGLDCLRPRGTMVLFGNAGGDQRVPKPRHPSPLTISPGSCHPTTSCPKRGSRSSRCSWMGTRRHSGSG